MNYFFCYTIDNCIGEMENPLYRERSSGIKFAKLSSYLAEHFPHEKLPKLKLLLKGMSSFFFFRSVFNISCIGLIEILLRDSKMYS